MKGPAKEIQTTADILRDVEDCPIRRGQRVNEIGADCVECLDISPDRALLCHHIDQGGNWELDPLLRVRFKPSPAIAFTPTGGP